MARPKRFAPDAFRFIGEDGVPRAVFDMTTRTLQGRFFLQPTKKTTSLVLGVLGRALALFPHVELYAYHVMSNHLSLTAGFRTAAEMGAFMCYFNGNTARVVGRSVRWRQKFWGRRYRAIPVVDEAALVERMEHSADNSVKEGLVERADQWPGGHFVKQILRGDEHGVGAWLDREGLRLARKKDPKALETAFTTKYLVRLSKAPVWNHLDDAAYREMILQLAEETRRKRRGRGAGGHALIFAHSAHHRPAKIAMSDAPSVHASCGERRRAWREAYAAFVDAYAQAMEALRAGTRAFNFPEGGIAPAARHDPLHTCAGDVP